MKGKFILLLLFCVTRLFSQTTPVSVLLSTDDGLSQGMVYDILQSRDGFIWIATKEGLNRYDGSRFEVFSPDPFNPFAIGGSEIKTLFEDSRGWIWVIYPNGLDVLDPVSGRFFHVKQAGKPVFSQWGEALAETPDGAVWLTDIDRIWKITVEKDMLAKAVKKGNADIEPLCKVFPMTNVSGWSGKPLQAGLLIFTRSKKLLLGTNQGIFRIDPNTGQIFPEMPIPDWITRCLAENANGDMVAKGVVPDGARQWVWISGSNTRFYKDPSRIQYSSLMFNFDAAGFLWAFRDRGIQKWRLADFFNNKSPEYEIKADSIFSNDRAYCTKFMFDKSGVCWIGTNGYGVFKINETVAKFKTALPKDSQRLLLEAPDGGIYSLEHPLVKYPSMDFKNGAPHSDFYVNLTADKIAIGRLAVCFDPAGNGWSNFREDSLLYRTDALTKTKKSFPWKGDGLLYTRAGTLVSVSETGLRRFDPTRETSADFPFDKPQKRASDNSHFLYEAQDGVIWIFGFDGLTKAMPVASGYRYEYYTNNPADRTSLSSNVVLSVVDDPLEPGRYLWVGTRGGGLNRLDKKTNKFKQYKTEQGLPDNVIYGILPESSAASRGSGHIWMSTNKGLCRFDVRSERVKNFKASDGLQDNEFNSSSYYKTRNGTMFFGGVKGLTIFHPDSLRFNDFVPQVHIVGLKVNNEKLDIGNFAISRSPIYLSHDQNLLTFDFAALEFTNPAQNQYRYQLVGIDQDWVALGTKNSIQFANLAPGDYTLKVEGSNNDGTWSEKPAELRFVIRPPWYSSYWAYLAYLLLAAGGIAWYYRYRLRQRLEHQETLRLRELDDFKSRFFTNITHEFRTPLTVILGNLEIENQEIEKMRQLEIGKLEIGKLGKSEIEKLEIGKLGNLGVTISEFLNSLTLRNNIIGRNSESLLRLINQILDLAKLESNTLKMNYIQGDVLTFMKYIAESLHSLANAQNLMLRVESEEAKIVMDYDPERFLQIIHNLLSNAIKFTPSGGKVILRANLEGSWLHIAVIDSGAGIPADELPHLFERFFQAKNQEQAKAGGTGIGLSLTRELVRAMGGEISVDSTVGAGSTFLVKLPVNNNGAFDEKWNKQGLEDWKMQLSKADSSAKIQADADGPADMSHTHILLIEDNPDVVEYLQACLQNELDSEGNRYVLAFAYNGQAGIEQALEHVPDLIVSDVMMPIKDGFEVVETLKNDERSSHIPIILLTAKADLQSRLAGLRRGADAYLSKPFHQEELLVTVRNLLGVRKKLQLKYQQNALAPEAVVPPDNADPEDNFLQKVRAIVESHYSDEAFGLPQLCQKVGMSRSQLFRKMKALTDIAPSDLIRKHRLNKARQLLESGAANVSEAAWEVGFKDPSYFTKLYQEEFGEAPSTTRK